ncbi:MAG: DUF167 domain-containing protein [Candidatus Micrarchaeota archaeon]|nr:DUF167 domain-containing protein [Candidatus Micrarchaeota archaeon]
MEIAVEVTANSKTASVSRTGGNSYRVKVDAQARHGRANARLIEILSEYLGVPKSSIRIAKGRNSRSKILSVIT